MNKLKGLYYFVSLVLLVVTLIYRLSRTAKRSDILEQLKCWYSWCDDWNNLADYGTWSSSFFVCIFDKSIHYIISSNEPI